MPGLGAGVGAYVSLIPGAGLIPGIASLTEDFQIDIGEITLQDFEEPSKISGGTTQTLTSHEYPGGTRTIDTYGAVPKNPTFSGRMMGPLSEQRVQTLETIVQQGLAVEFSYSQKKMLVVLEDLDWDFLNYYDIEYTLEIRVIVDYGLTNPATLSTELDSIFTEDLNSVSNSISKLVGGLF